jgi:hypothetical protein
MAKILLESSNQSIRHAKERTKRTKYKHQYTTKAKTKRAREKLPKQQPPQTTQH